MKFGGDIMVFHGIPIIPGPWGVVRTTTSHKEPFRGIRERLFCAGQSRGGWVLMYAFNVQTK